MVSPKAGYLFMNRSAIDEDAGSEVLKVLELEKSSLQMMDWANPYESNWEKYWRWSSRWTNRTLQLKTMQKRREKGIGL